MYLKFMQENYKIILKYIDSLEFFLKIIKKCANINIEKLILYKLMCEKVVNNYNVRTIRTSSSSQDMLEVLIYKKCRFS